MNRRSLLLALLLIIIGKAPPARAEELPLWEAGLGLGVIAAPDYRGADEGHTYLLPIPYFVYYGNRLSVDRRGVRGELLGSSRASFSVSASLGPPANSSDNSARRGMPNLDPAIEIGPSLDILLDDREDQNPSLTLRLPIRAVIVTDLTHFHNVGWVFLPHLAWGFKNLGPGGNWYMGFSVGPLFATKRLHDYYYTVSPEFATATRPAFNAHGGYSGAGVALTLSKRVGGYWVGGFLRYDDLHDTAFEDSPLVRSRHAFLAGIAFSKIFARSREPARTPPREP